MKFMKTTSQKVFLLILTLILTVAGSLVSCNFPQPIAPVDQSVFLPNGIDARFLLLYQTLGGEAVLGSPISAAVEEGDHWCQYMMNAKLCVVSGRTDLDAYSFAPVVLEGALMPSASYAQVSQESGKVVNGYVIHPDFIGLYEQLYGTIFTGLPLGNAWINYDKGRVEQYFENVVIAADLNDETPSAYLLPAAHAVCSICAPSTATVGSFIADTRHTSPFSTFLTRINGSVFGAPLTKPFINQDGLQVQIFENAAVAAQPDDLANAWLLPLSYELDMYESSPSEQRYGTQQDVVYYSVGQKGYHVLIWFDQFIIEHGGRNAAGNPIAEVAYYGDDIRQCFENYCLDLVQNRETGAAEASLVPLGAWYLDQQLQAGSITEDMLLVEWATPDTVQFEIGEQYPSVDRGTAQTIYLAIVSTETGKPLSGVSARVTLLTPDNQASTLAMPLTNAQGVTTVSVPAHSDLENGTVIRYEVCLDLVNGEEVCAVNAYLVKDTN